MEKKEERKNVLITVYVFILYNIFNMVWMRWFKNDLYVFSQPIGIVKWLIKFCTATSYPIIMAYTAKVNYSIAQTILNNAQTNKKHRFIEFAVLLGFIYFVIKKLSNDIGDFTFINYMFPYKEYQYNTIILHYLLLMLIGVIPSICAIINKIKNRKIIKQIAQLVFRINNYCEYSIIGFAIYLLGNSIYESKSTEGRYLFWYYIFASIGILGIGTLYTGIISYLTSSAIGKLLKNRLLMSYAIGISISYIIIICYDIVGIINPFCLSESEVFLEVSMAIITIIGVLNGIVEAI